MFVEGIKSVTSAIRPNTDNKISGVVEKVADGVVTVRTPYGNISIQTNEKFVVNQSISVGVFDIPDRANFIKLTLTVDGIKNISDKQTFEFTLNKNQQLDLERRAEIGKGVIIDIEEKIYEVELLSKDGKITAHTLKISDSNQAAQIFLRDRKVIINISDDEFTVLNPSNEILKIISDIPRNVIIQSYVREINNNQIQKKNQINSVVLEELMELAIDNNKDTIEEKLWKIAVLLSEQKDVEVVEGFKVFYLPIINNHVSSFVRFFVSENSARTETHFSKRFIIEFTKDGFRNLIDCLFSDDSGKKRIDVVVRMEKALDDEFKNGLIDVFNEVIKSLTIESTISFTTQMIFNQDIIHEDILS